MCDSLPALQVSGIRDKSKNDPEARSNHEHVVAAFEEAGYYVVSMVVDPTTAKLPVTRCRVHYIGIHRDSLIQSENKAPFNPDDLARLWKSATEDAKAALPDLPLDSYLWGSYLDEEVRKVPSVKQRWEKFEKPLDLGPLLPIQEAQEGPEKKKRRSELAWPELHKKVMSANDASRQQRL